MDEETQGNLDSFVDIIANTAGIMIVLVIFSLMNSDKAGSKHNVKKIALKSLTTAMVEVVKKIVKKEKEEKELQKGHDDQFKRLEASLSKFKLSTADIERLPEMLEKAQADKAAERVALEKMKADEEGAKRELDDEMIKVARKFTDEQIELLKDKNAEEIESALANIKSRTDALNQGIQASTVGKEGLEGEIDSLGKEMAVLVAQPGETLEVGGPTGKMARERGAVWAECFTPKEPRDDDGVIRPCVRLVSVEGFGKKEEEEKDKQALRVEASGESTFQIQAKDSAFQTYLAGKTDRQKEKLYLIFVVRPDAYRAFRLARKIARDDYGWKVDWRPML